MAEQNNLGLARRGRKMKYYPSIHCPLSDGATRQKKASPWVLSLWMNFAAVKFRIVFWLQNGVHNPTWSIWRFFFWYFLFQHEPSTLTVPKKKATLEAFFIQTAEVISEPLKVELAFDALATKNWSQKNTRDTEIPLKPSHTKSNIATNMYMMFQMSMTILQI